MKKVLNQDDMKKAMASILTFQEQTGGKTIIVDGFKPFVDPTLGPDEVKPLEQEYLVTYHYEEGAK